MDKEIAENPQENRYRIRSITKAMRVISAFDSDCFEISIGEIAHQSGVPKSTVHRIVSSLSEWNILEIGPDGKCRLGLKLFQLGSLVLSKMDVRKEALSFLKELSARRKPRFIWRSGMEIKRFILKKMSNPIHSSTIPRWANIYPCIVPE